MTHPLLKTTAAMTLSLTVLWAHPTARASDLIWDTTRHQQATERTTSASTRALESGGGVLADTEVADDFLAEGSIERVVLHGTSGSPGSEVVNGVFVRFYEWTAGGPGAMLAESYLDAADERFVFDVDDPRVLDITLPSPFEATGWHFIAVQPVMSGATWSGVESNRIVGPRGPINAFVYFRDNLAGGAWAQDTSPSGVPEVSDFRVTIHGTAQPIIESLETTAGAARSGRVVVRGSAFGAAPGDSTVLIDGLEAIVTQRFGQELRAYVPEAAALGTVNVEIVTPHGVSNQATIEVMPRVADGRVAWKFQTDRWMPGTQNMRVGPDGRIYTSDQIGLYALAPDGEFLWFVPDVGGGHAIDIGPDGTIYTGPTLDQDHPCQVHAFNTDGSLRWTFDCPQSPDTNHFLENGPNVGPDGNVYAVQNKLKEGDTGLGLFSLTPTSDLRWSDPGDPTMINVSALNEAELVFGPDRVYTGFVFFGAGPPETFAFDLDGDQVWFSGNSDLDARFYTHPRVDPAGRAIGRWGQIGLTSIEPDGTIRFARNGPQHQNLIMPAVDAEGNIYTAEQFGGELWSVDEDGDTRWFETDGPTGIASAIGASPNGTLVTCGRVTFGEPGVVRAYGSIDGAFQWEVLLEDEAGINQEARNRYPVFAADGSTAYITTSFSSVDAVQHGYLYALDLGVGGEGIPGDLDGDGDVDTFDLIMLLAAWGTPDGDVNGDGTTNFADLLLLLANWG